MPGLKPMTFMYEGSAPSGLIYRSTGTGSEIMQRIAVPMIGGMVSSTLLTLIVIPAIFGLVEGFRLGNADDAGSRCRRGQLSLSNESDRFQLPPHEGQRRPKIWSRKPYCRSTSSGIPMIRGNR